MRTILNKTALMMGLVIAAMLLAGCEEAVNPPPADDPKPPPAPLYTEIGAAELLERWSVLPNGAVAEIRPYPGPGRLAATDGFSGLPHFTFRDAREYGACVVFTVDYPAHAGAGAATLTGHIIDCVGTAAPGNTVTGLFHAAHMCDEPTGITSHILRAGNFNPTTYHTEHFRPEMLEDPFYRPEVDARIADHSDRFEWLKYAVFQEYEGDELVVDHRVLVNWAMLHNWTDHDTGEVHGAGMAGFETLHRHQEDLRFSIDDSAGVVDVEPNDGAAFVEYQRRCET